MQYVWLTIRSFHTVRTARVECSCRMVRATFIFDDAITSRQDVERAINCAARWDAPHDGGSPQFKPESSSVYRAFSGSMFSGPVVGTIMGQPTESTANEISPAGVQAMSAPGIPALATCSSIRFDKDHKFITSVQVPHWMRVQRSDEVHRPAGFAYYAILVKEFAIV